MKDYIVIPVSDYTRLIYHITPKIGVFYSRLTLQNKISNEWVPITKTNLEHWNSIGFNPNELHQIIEALQRLEKLLVLK